MSIIKTLLIVFILRGPGGMGYANFVAFSNQASAIAPYERTHFVISVLYDNSPRLGCVTHIGVTNT